MMKIEKHVKMKSKIILHTVATNIKDQDVKILLDPGADATMTSKAYDEKLNLNQTTSNQVLYILTLNS